MQFDWKRLMKPPVAHRINTKDSSPDRLLMWVYYYYLICRLGIIMSKPSSNYYKEEQSWFSR